MGAPHHASVSARAPEQNTRYSSLLGPPRCRPHAAWRMHRVVLCFCGRGLQLCDRSTVAVGRHDMEGNMKGHQPAPSDAHNLRLFHAVGEILHLNESSFALYPRVLAATGFPRPNNEQVTLLMRSCCDSHGWGRARYTVSWVEPDRTACRCIAVSRSRADESTWLASALLCESALCKCRGLYWCGRPEPAARQNFTCE